MSQVILDQRSVTRDALMQRALRAARGLHAAGVREGDAVALLLRNDFAFFEAQQAAAALGAYAVPINWHGKPEEVLYIVNDVRPRVLVAHADLLAPVLGQLPAGTQVIAVPTPPEARRAFALSDDAVALPSAMPGVPGVPEWNAWLEAFAPWDGPPLRSRATMIYTSGTTGRAKGVKRDAATPEQAAAYVELLRSVYGLRPGVRALIGTSFAGIFFDNCARNGLLALTLPADDVARLMRLALDAASNTLTVDLQEQSIRCGDLRIPFDIDPLRKDALLKGLDAIGQTLTLREDILAFQHRHFEANPWFQ